MKVLSFHSCIEADLNIFCGGRSPTKDDEAAIKAADAVILPQGCKENLYLLARRNCEHVFPNYDAFFKYPEKTGQAALFSEQNVAAPLTEIFHNLAAYKGAAPDGGFSKPFVFKLSWGGEGRNVFLIKSPDDLQNALELAGYWERRGKEGFLFQKYIPTGGRSLRIVVIMNKLVSYWRVGERPDSFYSNISKGATIDSDAFPEQQEAAVRVLQGFCKKTGINLAGFDFLFHAEEEKPLPLFLEINYFFRTKGLGGHDSYLKLLEKSIREWLDAIRRGDTSEQQKRSFVAS